MPEVKVMIGGRPYEVACQPGEENFLHAAAALLDTEAAVLGSQVGRVPEARMLLMAGLMLADKTAGMDDQVKALEARLAEREAEIEELKARPAAPVEVPVLPPGLTEALADLATRAEAIAAEAEAKAG